VSTTKTKSRPRPKPTRAAIGWPEALALWETHLRAQNKAAHTIRGYLFEARRLREYLDGRGLRAPGCIAVSHLRDYQVGLMTGAASRTGKPNAVRTVHRITTTLATLFGYLTAERLIERDPTLLLERPRLPSSKVGEVLTVDEMQRLLGAPERTTPKGLRDRALLEVLYGAGLRRAEALGLDLGDLDHAQRELRVRGKGSKERIVPLTRSAWGEVLTYLQRGRPALATTHPDSVGAVFLSPRGRRLIDQSILKLLRRYRVVAGLSKNVTPHTLRRTFATHLLKEGVHLRHIQALLGHEKLTTTALYLRLDMRELREELHCKHPRERIDA
jgi:integrase/recombinase XerD